jgi:hypothetical protein
MDMVHPGVVETPSEILEIPAAAAELRMRGVNKKIYVNLSM